MIRWEIPVVIAALAFGAGWTVNGWRVGQKLEEAQGAHHATVAEYQRKLAQGYADALTERERLEAQAQEAINERDQEIERLAAAAARIPDTIRVRVPAACPLPAAGSDLPGAAESPGAAGGVVSDGMGEGHQELDLRRATELMRRADEVTADLRATLKACRP